MSRNRSEHSAGRSSTPGLHPIQSTTPEQAQHVGAMLFHPHQLRIRTAGSVEFSFNTRTTKIGPFTIGTLNYSTPVLVRTPPYSTAYHINAVLHGSLRTAAGTQEVGITPAHAAVYRPDVDTAFSGWNSPCTMLAIKIEREEVERVAGAYLGLDEPAFLDLSLPLRVKEGLGAEFLATVRHLYGLASQSWDQPLVTKLLIEEAIIGLIRAADHSYHHLLEEIPTAPKTSLQRATELIHDAASEALTLGSIAYVAGVSGRALQLAFRKEYGMTPMKYLKNVRLDRAAKALRTAGPQGLTVSEVARGLGFTHMGRFSAAYAARHGELPSETLLSPHVSTMRSPHDDTSSAA